jgi:hypothetical protein
MSAPTPEREENTPQKLGLGLPSVKEVPEEEGKEETEESLPKEAMDLEKPTMTPMMARHWHHFLPRM